MQPTVVDLLMLTSRVGSLVAAWRTSLTTEELEDLRRRFAAEEQAGE